MAVRLLFFCVVLMLIVRVRGCAQHYIPHPGSVGVASLWHRYFGGRGLKSLGTPGLDVCASTC